MIKALYSKEEYKKQDEDFRIGAIISDGMWYSQPKWRKLAKVSEETIDTWINAHLENKMLIQSPTGAKSYRFPLSSIKKWYDDHNLDLDNHLNHNVQLLDFLFPPRIWAGLTETEGFLQSPRREIGVVSFICSIKVANEITERLKGIARVREVEPNKYKAYCLDSSYVKSIIEEIYETYDDQDVDKIWGRAVVKRRELVDFPIEFRQGLVMFYKKFGKNMVKSTMDTISIFLPDPDDQDTQIIIWIITAIEKFDESGCVPFSGYLNTVLKRWPYDLPQLELGKELSDFQRARAKAIVSLKEKKETIDFSSVELSEEMGYNRGEFNSLEEKHKIWLSTKTASNLMWDENNEEKQSDEGMVSSFNSPATAANDINLANKLSFAVVQAALDTEKYEDAFTIISQIDITDINTSIMSELSDEFIHHLGNNMGI